MTQTQQDTSSSTIVLTSDHKVSCNGDGGALGHPKVFLEMGADGEVICGYCDRHFVLKNGPSDPGRPQ